MGEIMIEKAVETGLDRVMMYDNIAIVILTVIVLIQWGVIGILLRAVLGDRKNLMEILKNLWTTLATLNERLHKK